MFDVLHLVASSNLCIGEHPACALHFHLLSPKASLHTLSMALQCDGPCIHEMRASI